MLQIVFKEALSAGFGSTLVGSHAKAALDEESERGLPRGTKIEKRATAEAIEVPEKFFQTVGNARGFLHFRRAIDANGQRGAVGLVCIARRRERARRRTRASLCAAANAQLV